jgi:hypothetical protein
MGMGMGMGKKQPFSLQAFAKKPTLNSVSLKTHKAKSLCSN